MALILFLQMNDKFVGEEWAENFQNLIFYKNLMKLIHNFSDQADKL